MIVIRLHQDTLMSMDRQSVVVAIKAMNTVIWLINVGFVEGGFVRTVR